MKGRVLRPIPGTGYSIGELASFTKEQAEKYAEYLGNKDYFEQTKGKDTQPEPEKEPEVESDETEEEVETEGREDDEDDEEEDRVIKPATPGNKETAKATGGRKATR